jgi:SAM-dependent methyltransferase
MVSLKAPKRWKGHARALRFAWKSLTRLFGNHYPRHCTICGHEGRFFAYGFPLVADVTCPKCLSLERHRALALYDSRNGLFAGRDILHFAPEPGLSSLIRSKSPKSYKTCDLFAAGVDLKINIERIDLPDETFDLVLCLHVLEHVDDSKAMPELFRITRRGGTAIVMVPMEEGLDQTYENPQITSRADRLLHFGQEDHVRYYGRDLRDRLKAAGFDLSEWTCVEPDVVRYGLKRGEKIFVCRRP